MCADATLTSPETLTPSAEWQRGWKTAVSAAAGCGNGIALFILTAGLFIKPLQADFGWSRSVVTVTPIISASIACGSLPAGYLVDRWGSRVVALCGLAALSGAIGLFAFVPRSLFAYYGLTLVVGLISATVAFGPFCKGIGTWFRSGLGGAIGLTLSGPSIIAMLAIPVLAKVIQTYGWRAGYATLAAFPLFIGLPITALFFRERLSPASPVVIVASPAAVDGLTMRQAISCWHYWALLIVAAIMTIPLGGFVVHLQPLLTDKSISITKAASLGVVYALSATAGRLAGGLLFDRYQPYIVAAALFCIAAAGSLLTASIQFQPSFVAAALPLIMVALGAGAEGDYLAFFTRRFFGMRSYATILGSLSMPSALFTGVGAFLFAVIFDHTHSYHLACVFGCVCFFVGSIATLALGLAERFAPAPAQRVKSDMPLDARL